MYIYAFNNKMLYAFFFEEVKMEYIIQSKRSS